MSWRGIQKVKVNFWEQDVHVCTSVCTCWARVEGPGTAGGYLWSVWLPGVGRVQLSEDPFVLGL